MAVAMNERLHRKTMAELEPSASEEALNDPILGRRDIVGTERSFLMFTAAGRMASGPVSELPNLFTESRK